MKLNHGSNFQKKIKHLKPSLWESSISHSFLLLSIISAKFVNQEVHRTRAGAVLLSQGKDKVTEHIKKSAVPGAHRA